MLPKLLIVLFPPVLLMISLILFDDVETVDIPVLICPCVDFNVPTTLATDVAVPTRPLASVIVEVAIFHMACC